MSTSTSANMNAPIPTTSTTTDVANATASTAAIIPQPPSTRMRRVPHRSTMRPATALPMRPIPPPTVSASPKPPTLTPARSRTSGKRAITDDQTAPLTKNCIATESSARRSRPLRPSRVAGGWVTCGDASALTTAVGGSRPPLGWLGPLFWWDDETCTRASLERRGGSPAPADCASGRQVGSVDREEAPGDGRVVVGRGERCGSVIRRGRPPAHRGSNDRIRLRRVRRSQSVAATSSRRHRSGSLHRRTLDAARWARQAGSRPATPDHHLR